MGFKFQCKDGVINRSVEQKPLSKLGRGKLLIARKLVKRRGDEGA